MPKGYDETNSLASLGFVRMFMKCLLEIARTLGVCSDRIEKWQDIVDCLPVARVSEINDDTVINDYIVSLGRKIRKIEPNGKKVICPSLHNGIIESYVLEYIFPAGGASPIHEPEMYEAAKNTFEILDCWEDERMPYGCGDCKGFYVRRKRIHKRVCSDVVKSAREINLFKSGKCSEVTDTRLGYSLAYNEVSNEISVLNIGLICANPRISVQLIRALDSHRSVLEYLVGCG